MCDAGEDAEGEEQKEYASVFFLMHQWFMKSEELAQAFVDLYPCWCIGFWSWSNDYTLYRDHCLVLLRSLADNLALACDVL